MRVAQHIVWIAALAAATVAPASAMTLRCVTLTTGSWQDGDLTGALLAPDEALSTAFTINLDTGAFHRDKAGAPAEAIQYQVLSVGSDDPDSDNEDFVALAGKPPGLIRIKLEGGVYLFMRDYKRSIEVGTCSLEDQG